MTDIFNKLKTNPETKEFFKSFSIAIVMAILIRSLICEPFSIPSPSMEPNYIEGDYFFVSKFKYGFNRYSFPYNIGINEQKILSLKKPQRGDVFVFRTPKNPNIFYIKRIVGTQNDTIRVINGDLYVNGEKLKKEFLGNEINTSGIRVQTFLETNSDGASYKIYNESNDSQFDNTSEFKVPENHYFFMGDNRDNSLDSRLSSGPVGYVDEKYLIGKPEILLFSNKESLLNLPKWLTSFKIERFFKRL